MDYCLIWITDNASTQMVSTPTRGTNILYIFIIDKGPRWQNLVTHVEWMALEIMKQQLIWSQADFQDIRNRVSLLCEKFAASYFSSSPAETLYGMILQESVANTQLASYLSTSDFPTKLSSPNSNQLASYLHQMFVQMENNALTIRLVKLTSLNTDPSITNSKGNVSGSVVLLVLYIVSYVSSLVDLNKHVVPNKLQLWSYIKESKRLTRLYIGVVGHLAILFR